MKLKLNAGWLYGALLVLLSAWVLHGFLEPLLAARACRAAQRRSCSRA
jgi:hypothetical protein